MKMVVKTKKVADILRKSMHNEKRRLKTNPKFRLHANINKIELEIN